MTGRRARVEPNAVWKGLGARGVELIKAINRVRGRAQKLRHRAPALRIPGPGAAENLEMRGNLVLPCFA